MQKNQDLICKCGKKIEITVPMYADKDDNFVCKECYKKARGWTIKIFITNTGKKEANEVYRRIEDLADKLTSIGPTIKISKLQELM